MIDKRKAEDVAKLAATNLSAMIIDATPKINDYLNGTATGISPLGTTVVLTAIGARHCGLNEKRIVELLTKLDADGMFGGERKAPTKFAVIAGTPVTVEEAMLWEDAIAALGGELGGSAFADIVIILNADAVTVKSMRELNPAKIIAVLPTGYEGSLEDVHAAGADLVLQHLSQVESAKHILGEHL